MGGYGSTRWNGIPTKYTTTDCHRFDIKTLPFAEYMQAAEPHGRQYYWTQQGKRSGDIAIYFYPARNCLIFVYEAVSEESRQHIEERIRVSKTPLNLGGFQWFIHCPQCDRRGRILYKTPKGSRFLCRDCYKLSYLSCQQSHQWDRGRFASLGAMQQTADKIDSLTAKLRRKRPGSIAHRRIWQRRSKLYRIFDAQLKAAEIASGLFRAKINKRIAKLGLEDEWRKRKQS